MIWRAILAREPRAIAVTKVKGHATEQDVEEGRVRVGDKIGNDASDKLATDGIQGHGVHIVALSNWLAARHRAYCRFMVQVHMFIIHVMEADKEERDRRARARNPFDTPIFPTVTIPIQLNYGIDVGSRRIPAMELPIGVH